MKDYSCFEDFGLDALPSEELSSVVAGIENDEDFQTEEDDEVMVLQ